MKKHTVTIEFTSDSQLSLSEWADLQLSLSAQITEDYKLHSVELVKVEGINE